MLPLPGRHWRSPRHRSRPRPDLRSRGRHQGRIPARSALARPMVAVVTNALEVDSSVAQDLAAIRVPPGEEDPSRSTTHTPWPSSHPWQEGTARNSASPYANPAPDLASCCSQGRRCCRSARSHTAGRRRRPQPLLLPLRPQGPLLHKSALATCISRHQPVPASFGRLTKMQTRSIRAAMALSLQRCFVWFLELLPGTMRADAAGPPWASRIHGDSQPQLRQSHRGPPTPTGHRWGLRFFFHSVKGWTRWVVGRVHQQAMEATHSEAQDPWHP